MLVLGFASPDPPETGVRSKERESWKEALKAKGTKKELSSSRLGLFPQELLCWFVGWLNFLATVHSSSTFKTEATLEETSWKTSRISASFGDKEFELWLLLLSSFEIPCE